jgi:hypothetical protein
MKTMKKSVKVLSLPFAALLFITGCGDEEVVQNPPAEQAGTSETTSDQNQSSDQTVLLLKDFELSVEYAKDKEYKVEYETLDNETEASIEDEVNDKHLQGDEAMDELMPLLEQLTFNEKTSKENVIKEVIAAFNLNEDYQEFELEVQFNDDTIKEYEDHK